MLFAIGCGILSAFDIYLSYRRIRDFGGFVELNPVARRLALDQGPTAACIFLALANASVLIGLVYYHADTLLHILFGGKLALAAMQLRSLEITRKPLNVKTNLPSR